MQCKVLTPNDFTDLAEVEARLLAFERRYEQTAAPFEWKFTRSDSPSSSNDSATSPTTRPPPDHYEYVTESTVLST